MQPPPTQYVDRDGISIAYQVVGDGPLDLIVSPGFISISTCSGPIPPGEVHVPAGLIHATHPLRQAGHGPSDPIPRLPTLEERVADLEAVLDVAGSERAVLLGISEGGPSSVVLAAMRPERVLIADPVRHLCVWPTRRQRLPGRSGHAFGAKVRASSMALSTHWGDGARLMELFAPSAGELQQRFYRIFARAAASPSMVRALVETGSAARHTRRAVVGARTDARAACRGRPGVPIEAGGVLANGIAGRTLGHVRGHGPCLLARATSTRSSDEIERFVTGSVHRAEPDRALASVLFTDIVESTKRAAGLGDSAWREVLERHDALVERAVDEHGGRIVKHVGDGALSAFDGPAKAIRCAEALCDRVAELGIELRAGIHTGECEALGEDLGGLAVHIGARVSALARPNEILVSSTVKELVVGSGMQFLDRGEHELKGVPDAWHLYSLGEVRAPRAELDGAARLHAPHRPPRRVARASNPAGHASRSTLGEPRRVVPPDTIWRAARPAPAPSTLRSRPSSTRCGSWAMNEPWPTRRPPSAAVSQRCTAMSTSRSSPRFSLSSASGSQELNSQLR